MTMSILDLLQHIVNEPAPKLGEPWGDETMQGKFVDDCLRKDPNERPSPGELLVSFSGFRNETRLLLFVFVFSD